MLILECKMSLKKICIINSVDGLKYKLLLENRDLLIIENHKGEEINQAFVNNLNEFKEELNFNKIILQNDDYDVIYSQLID